MALQGALADKRGFCPAPFFDASFFSGGFVEGRLCQIVPGHNLTCCLPCPATEWSYSDSIYTVNTSVEWMAVPSTICCLFLLLSWAVLPVDKTLRHYLSISLTISVVLINLGFIMPLAAQPSQCFDEITPNDMYTNPVCAASGALIILGGWAAVFWVFLRSLSLHLQICWQVVVGRSFMWCAHVTGWGIPLIGLVVAMTVSGVSFRFGTTCHINHHHSLATLWIPLLLFAGSTIVIQFATFGYCIRVYLASLVDADATSTQNSNMPAYQDSVRTMTPRQAYRRVRRVIQLQWRGILIVLIIVADVIFFSMVFVFQDTTAQRAKNDSSMTLAWAACLVQHGGTKAAKNACLVYADELVVNLGTITTVLFLLAMNGFWALFLLARWSMLTAWWKLLTPRSWSRRRREFVSVDANMALDDLKQDTSPYRTLYRDMAKLKDEPGTPSLHSPVTPWPGKLRSPMTPVTPRSPVSPPVRPHMHPPRNQSLWYHQAVTRGLPPNIMNHGGRRTPDYFGRTARYQPPMRSFSSPRPPQSMYGESSPYYGDWNVQSTYARPMTQPADPDDYVNPLGMNRI